MPDLVAKVDAAPAHCWPDQLSHAALRGLQEDIIAGTPLWVVRDRRIAARSEQLRGDADYRAADTAAKAAAAKEIARRRGKDKRKPTGEAGEGEEAGVVDPAEGGEEPAAEPGSEEAIVEVPEADPDDSDFEVSPMTEPTGPTAKSAASSSSILQRAKPRPKAKPSASSSGTPASTPGTPPVIPPPKKKPTTPKTPAPTGQIAARLAAAAASAAKPPGPPPA